MGQIRKSIRVFMAEDSAFMRDRVTELFATLPEVEMCGMVDNAAQAIRARRADPVDVVIRDLDLGADNGLDVLKAVKQGPEAPVVVILSIHPFRELWPPLRRRGADYYFEKASAFDDLRNLLEELSQRIVPENV